MAVPLQDLIRRESITDEELALLRESQANSDHLVLMEKQAFAAMKGLFEDGNGNFTVQRAPNRDFAVKLLFSEDYTVEKARIMLHPVELLNVQASEIAEGNYAARCDISSANEIGELCANFNKMANSLESDFLARRTAEEVLRFNMTKLELALQSSKMGTWQFNIMENKRVFDNQVCLLMGIEPATFGGTAEEFFAMMHPDDREKVNAALQRTMEQDVPYEPEYRVVWPDGSIHHISARGKLLQDDKGNAEMISGIIWDTTDSKLAEAYREMGLEVLQILNKPGDLQSAIQLVIAALKTQTGFDAVGIRLQDGDDFPYFAQKGFFKDFLLTENTLVERGADGRLCRDKDGNASLECTCGLVISGKTNQTLPFFTRGGSFWTSDSLPLLDLPADHDPRLHPRNQCMRYGYSSMALVPIRDKDRIVGLLHFNDRRKGCFTLETIKLLEEIATHIGEALMRKRLEAEKAKLEEQNRQLQKAESLGRMSGSIAHIFNNQLSVVMGYLELVIGELPPRDPRAAKLATAMQATMKAAEVSGNLLAYLGQKQVKLESLELAELCRASLTLIQAGKPENVLVEIDLPSSGPCITADAKQIQQILTNLAINAWESIGEGAGTIHIGVRTVSPADIPASHRFPLEWHPKAQPYACLEVTDSGCGIREEDMEKLFDPFFSTKFTGRGLGLSIVLGIAKTHGAVVTVENRIGGGSVFSVFFPLSKQIPDRPPDQLAKAPENVDGVTVLLVEYEEEVSKMTASMLISLGFTVLQARDGVEAVDIFGQHKDEISCLLSDLTMPHMGGWETIAALRAIRHDLPVVLASGYDEASVMAGEHSELPDFFLNKPYNLNKLGDTVCHAIARKAMAGKRAEGKF